MNTWNEVVESIINAKGTESEKINMMIGKLCNLHYKLGFAEANDNFEAVEEISNEIEILADEVNKVIYDKNRFIFDDKIFSIYTEVVNDIYESNDDGIDGIDEVDEIALDIMVNYELTDKDKEELISYFCAVRDDYNKTKMVELNWDDEFTVKLGCRKWIDDTFFKNGGKKTIFETFFKNK